MLHQFLTLFGSGAGIIHDGLLAAALVAYGLGAKHLWINGRWEARGLYGLGGILLLYYEVHMMWLWFVLGFVAIVVAMGLPSGSYGSYPRRDQARSPGQVDSKRDIVPPTKHPSNSDRERP